MNPVHERLNELIPVKQELYDFQGLFNCLRPDPPEYFNEPEKEVHECSVCKEEATREVKYLTPAEKKAVTILVCDDCFYEDYNWRGRQIIQTTHL